MKNVDIRKEKDKIIIEIDATKEFGRSKKGVSIIVASTLGNHQIPGTDIVLGLNAYKPI